ncbi:MAG: hypothetical protein AWM53_01481 [Candidatus Dichloromethanomonas elyunquensis]|nr:MAG: hypothetical protein AWM53_01481 [Candidatus Dichloromethanomonas elyunquensis]
MSQDQNVFKCHKISKGVASGEALVSQDDMNFYMVEPSTGIVVDRGNSIEGRNITGTVLIFRGGKGSSVVMADGLYQLTMTKRAPRAMIIKNPETVLVASAIVMKIPLVDRVDPKFYDTVQDGDLVEVDANQGIITVTRKQA